MRRDRWIIKTTPPVSDASPRAVPRTVKPPSFLITIDTEGDNAWSRPTRITTANVAFLARFQRLCEGYALKPTYLTTWEIADSSQFVELARDVHRRGSGEIGMHLHAWNTPPLAPLTDNDYFHQPYLIEYDAAALHEKVRLLTQKLEQTLETKMTSHRAGRWAFNEVYAGALIDNGYLVDCSVTPHVSWKAASGAPGGTGGADYTGFPEEAYWLDPLNMGARGDSTLLEVPMTIVLRRESSARRLARMVLRKAPLGPSWLRPTGNNLDQMLGILDQAREEGRDYVEFMLHSSELMPGGSPTFPDVASIERLYRDLEGLFGATRNRFVGMTLTEYHGRVTARRHEASRNNAAAPTEPVAGSPDRHSAGRTQRPLNVAMLLPNLHIGGSQQMVRTLARHLSTAGCEPFVCALFDGGPLLKDLDAQRTPVEVFKFTRRSVLAFPWYIADIVQIWRTLSQYLKRNAIDVIQMNNLGTETFLVVALARFRGVPVTVATFHSQSFLPSGTRQLLRRVVHRVGIRVSRAWTSRFVAVSDQTKRALMEGVGVADEDITVICNGVDVDAYSTREVGNRVRQELGLDDGAHLLIAVGTLREAKGHRYLIRAAGDVVRQCPDAHFLLVGEGELEAELREQTTAARLTGHVHFLGSRRDVADLLAASDMLVLPSLWEGLSMALLEGMAAAKPIVASEVSGTRQALRHRESGILVPPGNAQALAEAILEALRMPVEDARQMGRRARETVVAQFSAEKQAKEYAGLFYRLMGKGASRRAPEFHR